MALFFVPLRINFPSGFMRPNFLPDSLLTDSFFSKLSNFKCSVSLSNCSSVSDLSRNAATLAISPRKSFVSRNQIKWHEIILRLIFILPSSCPRRTWNANWDDAVWTKRPEREGKTENTQLQTNKYYKLFVWCIVIYYTFVVHEELGELLHVTRITLQLD